MSFIAGEEWHISIAPYYSCWLYKLEDQKPAPTLGELSSTHQYSAKLYITVTQ